VDIKKLETPWFFVIGGILFAFILIIVYNINPYFFDYCTNCQLILGLFSGIGFGIGIVGLIRTNWWQNNSYRMINIIFLLWEGFILAFTIYYMFPHIGKEVFKVGENISLNDLQPYYIFNAFSIDIKNCWYIYALFLFTILVWILLLLNRQKINKSEKYYDSTKFPKLFFTFLILSVIIVLFLKYRQILPNAEYKFFDNDQFWFGLLIGLFGAIFILILLNLLIKKRFKKHVKYSIDAYI